MASTHLIHNSFFKGRAASSPMNMARFESLYVKTLAVDMPWLGFERYPNLKRCPLSRFRTNFEFSPNELARPSMLRIPSPSFWCRPFNSNPRPSSCTVTSSLLPVIRRTTLASFAPLCFLKFRSPSCTIRKTKLNLGCCCCDSRGGFSLPTLSKSDRR